MKHIIEWFVIAALIFHAQNITNKVYSGQLIKGMNDNYFQCHEVKPQGQKDE